MLNKSDLAEREREREKDRQTERERERAGCLAVIRSHHDVVSCPAILAFHGHTHLPFCGSQTCLPL